MTMYQEALQKGEHLCYPMDISNLWHHGIYCGSCSIRGRKLENVVIHFEGKFKRGMIMAVPFDKFARNHEVYKLDYKQNASLPPERVVNNAISKLGKPDYNLLGNNCERFAH